MSAPKILLAGGGTGGHLVPGLCLARSLAADGVQVHLARAGRAVEEEFFASVGSASVESHVVPWRGNGIRMVWQLVAGLRPAARLLDRIRPDVVVGLGGGSGVPCLMTAARRRIPFVLLEQNVIPGKANRLMARFARRVYTAFPETARASRRANAVHSGMPLRPEIFRTRECVGAADRLRREFGIHTDKTVLLVAGGSQGAAALNVGVPDLLSSLPDEIADGLAVVHLSGRGKEGEALAAYRKVAVEAHILPFHCDTPALYELCDLVICRGGGTTLIEVAAAGRVAVVVPYPHHRDQHQLANARWFEERGVARVLTQAELQAGNGLGSLVELLSDHDLRASMARVARTVLPIDAGARISGELMSLARDSASRVTARTGAEVM